MRKRIAGLFLVLLLAAGSWWGYARFFEKKPARLQASGTIEATEVNLAAKIPGTLESLAVKEGDGVKKGQVVAVVGRSDLAAQWERDALGVRKAEAQLADLLAGAREQEINDARAAVNIAQAGFERAGADYNRLLALHESGAVPAAELEKAKTALDIAKNQLDSARAKLSLLESGTRPEQVAAARAELERSRAVLKATESQLDDTKIASFIDGTVISRNFEPGEYVFAGSPVVTVADLNDHFIRVYVPTDYLPAIRLGQKVSFSVSGLSGEYPGTIVEIAGKGEFTPKTIQTKEERTNVVFAVKVKIDSQNGTFKPGMPADVTF
ncbi:MAG: HlyD family secretion protein [Desulfotomaculales bacterium]